MADTKITALTALTTHDQSDPLAIVDDPSGVPVTKKITRQNLFTPQYFFAEKTSQQALTTSMADITGWVAAEQADAAFTWDNTNGILTINTTGLYIVWYQIMWNLPSGTRFHGFGQLMIDPLGGGSYAAENGMRTAGYGRTVDEGSSSMCQKILSLTATDKIKLQALEVGGGEINGPTYPGTYLSAYLMA